MSTTTTSTNNAGMNTVAKKVIVTFGVGYNHHHIKPFIVSCTRHAPDADIVIYVGNNILELQARFSQFPRVKFIRYEENLFAKLISKVVMKLPRLTRGYAAFVKFLHGTGLLRPVHIGHLAAPLVQFMVKRFFALHQLTLREQYDQWMFTDLRDVLLQADPFSQLTENRLVTGVEPVRIAACAMNRKWVLRTYGAAVLGSIGNRPIACAGVTLGSRKAMLRYLAEVINDTLQQLPRIIGMLGADQAIHNKVLYTGLPGIAKEFERNGDGSIATLHYSELDEFVLEAGVLRNPSGKELAVVHQYDRHPHLAAQLLAGFRSQSVPAFAHTA